MRFEYLLLLAAFGLMQPVSLAAEECRLCGNWKSHADKTVADMQASPNVSAEAKEKLGDGFFGRLVVEFTETQGRSYFSIDGHVDEWSYKMLREDGNTILLEFSYAGTDHISTHEVIFEGECYKLLVLGGDFFEYFCRV